MTLKETNEVSGSKGEANFVWRCRSCKVSGLSRLGVHQSLTHVQRESTASIKDSLRVYPQASPPRTQNIIDIDCRGLEFIEFKADVRLQVSQ